MYPDKGAMRGGQDGSNERRIVVGPIRMCSNRGALHLAQRIAAAVFGGYALAVVMSACLSFVLPMARVDAVSTGLLASFLVYAAFILWVFAVPSLRRMWLGLGGAMAVFGAAFVLLAPDGIL